MYSFQQQALAHMPGPGPKEHVALDVCLLSVRRRAINLRSTTVNQTSAQAPVCLVNSRTTIYVPPHRADNTGDGYRLFVPYYRQGPWAYLDTPKRNDPEAKTTDFAAV